MSTESPAKTRWGERHRVLGITVPIEEYEKFCQIAENNRITPTQAFLQELDKESRKNGEKQGYDRGFKEGQEQGYKAGKEKVKNTVYDILEVIKNEGLGNTTKTNIIKFIEQEVDKL